MVRSRSGAGMPRSRPDRRAFMLWIALGIFFPVGILVGLLAFTNTLCARPRGDGTARVRWATPGPVRPAGGVLDAIAERAQTAVYADGSSATIAQTDSPDQVIEKYCSSMHERTSTSSSVGGFTQRDAISRTGASRERSHRENRALLRRAVAGGARPPRRAKPRYAGTIARIATRSRRSRGIAVLIGAGWLAS